jgi:hypothetical protein
MSFKFGIPPSLLEAVKKVTTEQKGTNTTAKKLESDEELKKTEVKEDANICAVCDHDPCICETGQHIEEAEGGGTAVKDVKDQAKAQADRAKLTLQSAMLKMKQAKEREALAKKKGSIKEADEYKTGGKPLEKKLEKSINETGGPKVFQKDNKHIEKYSDDKFWLYVDNKKTKEFSSLEMAKAAALKEHFDLQEKSDYEVYHKDYSSAVQTAIKQAEKRGFEVDMDDWHDKVATGPKKPSAGKTNSFSVKLTKDGKPVKKALQLQVYNMDNHKYELNMYIESLEEGTQKVDSLVTDALKIMRGSQSNDAVQALKTVLGDREYNDRRGHYNFYVKQLVDMYGKRDIKEAASPAQQAAIAIAMKKDGKKPKDMEESDAYDKDVKPSDKPHDKDAADKRAKLAAVAARKKMSERAKATVKKVVEEFEKKKKKGDKEQTAADNNKSIKGGEKLTGKKEPIEIEPELKDSNK